MTGGVDLGWDRDLSLESRNVEGRGKGFRGVVGVLVPGWVLGAREGASCRGGAEGV
jgi:hypothetical protein